MSPHPAAPETLTIAEPVPTGSVGVRSKPRHRQPSPKFRAEGRDRFRRWLARFCANLLSWTIGVLPWTVRYWLADRAGDLWARAAPAYRANVADNLAQVLKIDPDSPAMTPLVRDVFRFNARNFTDLFRMPHWNETEYQQLVTIENEELSLLEAVLARGKGAVLVTAHLGAFDVVAHALTSQGFTMIALTGRTTTRFVFDMITHLRHRETLSAVEPTAGGVRKVIQALRRNEIAGFVTDYDFFQNGLPVTMFDRATSLPPGPIRIARDTGSQVIGAFARRTNGGYLLNFSEPFDVPKTRDQDADIAAGMRQLVSVLETAIGANPEQWVILQRVWPETPAESERVTSRDSPPAGAGRLLTRIHEPLPPPPHNPAPA